MMSPLLPILSLLPLLAFAKPIPSGESSQARRAISLPGGAHGMGHLNTDGTFSREHAARERVFIAKRYPSTLNFIEENTVKARKRAGPKKACKRAGPKTTVAVKDQVSDGYDVAYYGNVGLGKPPQPIPLQFDTGSADLWVAACATKNNRTAGQYNPFKSAAHRGTYESFEITYQAGSAAGTIAYEAVTLGDFLLPRQYIGVVNQTDEEFAGAPFHGIMGLGPSSLSSMGKTNVIDNLINYQIITDKLIGLYLGRGKVDGSELTVGGVNSAHYRGPVVYTPTILSSRFAVYATGLTVGGNTVTDGVVSIIDSGTTYITVPHTIAAAVYKNIPGTVTETLGSTTYYQIPCTAKPNVGFLFSGSSTVLPMQEVDFIMGKVSPGSNLCYGAVVAQDMYSGSTPFALIGIPFLKSYYSIFTYDGNHGSTSVGFAKSVA